MTDTEKLIPLLQSFVEWECANGRFELPKEQHVAWGAAEEIKRLRQWVNDLQAGMYINCVYCGHRYGPDSEVPATMADVLKAHIEQCPAHPMSALKRQRDELLALVKEARADWQHQWESLPNTLVDYEEADELDALIKKCDALIAKADVDT